MQQIRAQLFVAPPLSTFCLLIERSVAFTIRAKKPLRNLKIFNYPRR